MRLRSQLSILGLGVALLAYSPAATAGTDAVALKAGFRPNPAVVDSVAAPAPTVGGAGYPFFRCPFTGYTSAQPAYRFTVEGAAQRLRMRGGGTWLVVQNQAGEYWCGHPQDRDRIEATLEPGAYSVFFVTGSAGDRPRPVTLVFEDTKRPIAFADGGRVVDVPAHPSEPILIDGMVAAQPEPDRGWCNAGRFGREPDFFLRSTGPVSEVRIALAWSPKSQALRLFSPARPHEPLCPPNHERAMGVSLLDGLYAVWVGDAKAAAGVPYRVVVTTRDMKLDALTTYSRPTAGMTLQQRDLARHYWSLGRFKGAAESKRAGHDALTRRLFLEAPKELFVFARVDLDAKQVSYQGGLRQWDLARAKDALPALQPAPPRAGEPLLVLFGKTGDFLTADGEIVGIDARLVSLEPPGPAVVPRAPRVTEAPYEAAEELAETDEASKRQAFAALADKAQQCYTRYMEQHNRSGDARNFEVVTRHGGEISTENLADRLDRVAAAQCHTDKVLKERAKLAGQLAVARTRRRTADLAKIDERMRALFPRGAASSGGPAASADERQDE